MRRKDRLINEKGDLELIISRSDVCRIAIADKDVPYIVTMNFGYSGGDNPCFYFHCAIEGRKMEMIKKNNFVCFELDTDHELSEGENGCDWGMKFSSVIGYGKISILTDKDSRLMGLNSIMAHYSDRKFFSYDEKVLEKTTILRLNINEMTGKRK
jgi:uncharacterized protein